MEDEDGWQVMESTPSFTVIKGIRSFCVALFVCCFLPLLRAQHTSIIVLPQLGIYEFYRATTKFSFSIRSARGDNRLACSYSYSHRMDYQAERARYICDLAKPFLLPEHRRRTRLLCGRVSGTAIYTIESTRMQRNCIQASYVTFIHAHSYSHTHIIFDPHTNIATAWIHQCQCNEEVEVDA